MDILIDASLVAFGGWVVYLAMRRNAKFGADVRFIMAMNVMSDLKEALKPLSPSDLSRIILWRIITGADNARTLREVHGSASAGYWDREWRMEQLLEAAWDAHSRRELDNASDWPNTLLAFTNARFGSDVRGSAFDHLLADAHTYGRAWQLLKSCGVNEIGYRARAAEQGAKLADRANDIRSILLEIDSNQSKGTVIWDRYVELEERSDMLAWALATAPMGSPAWQMALDKLHAMKSPLMEHSGTYAAT